MPGENEVKQEEVKQEEVKQEQKPTGPTVEEVSAKLQAMQADHAKLAAENEALKTHVANASRPQTSQDDQWRQAEDRYGMSREEILRNAALVTDMIAPVKQENEHLKRQLATRSIKESIEEDVVKKTSDDPVAVKYRGAVGEFLRDVPAELLATQEGRDRWVTKAIDYAKSKYAATPAPAPRTRSSMDFSFGDGGSGNEPNPVTDYSKEEIAVIQEHGLKAEDYKKLQHPIFKDGIQLPAKFEKPRFK